MKLFKGIFVIALVGLLAISCKDSKKDVEAATDAVEVVVDLENVEEGATKVKDSVLEVTTKVKDSVVEGAEKATDTVEEIK
jgi:hypothetical protein